MKNFAHTPPAAFRSATNISIGHGAIDLGGGYTYLNPVAGNEFSGAASFTCNFKNPDTQYQSGISEQAPETVTPTKHPTTK
jgi:hypothetical protein